MFTIFGEFQKVISEYLNATYYNFTVFVLYGVENQTDQQGTGGGGESTDGTLIRAKEGP